ncbi:cysteine peptidase family C39 domain-containing protein [Qiania dongpingensis]|uniref:Uncharacterized protein n=1 Tax=Qiania dongpingensis TaxID=2763669 RepID=A0A7G9G0M1_9FIRM|nr:hypothetical protein [Qiania dongpingensis]QNM04353.1 hypothetical protein H9Q78_07570 [Qiania dongpingensis]
MKKILKRLLVLVIVFVAAVAAVLFFTRKKKQEVVYAVMDSASLPVVTMEFEGSAVNTLHGYAGAMEASYMRDTITPIPQDRKLSFQVDTYGNTVKGIEFEIRSLDGANLIETKSCDSYSGDSETVRGEIVLQDLLNAETEYILILKLKTDKWDSAYYYTRIRYYGDTHIGEQIAFAQNFSELAFSKNTSEELTVQLESSSDADNSSLGYADIKSSYRHVTWGDLSPQRSGEIRIDIKEMNKMVGSIQLSYGVTAEGDSGKVESYNVKEFFSVRYVDGKLWLIAYERTMDQAFEASDITIQNGKIELGIVSPGNLPIETASAGDHTAFVADGELWSYNKKENEASKLFSFKEKNDDGVRTLYDQHKFRIISVGEEGDVAFTVYGYMNRGSHEGECGLVFYQYSRAENAIHEVFFIPSAKPFQILKEEIGTLSYVGNNQLFYLMFGNSIYAIDFSGEEYVEIISGMEEDSFVISEDSSAVAWQEEEDIYGGKNIQVFYMDDGTNFTIHASEGETIRALGFIDGDFIYGRARESDIEKGSLIVNYPMYALEIIDRKQQIQTTYQRDGIYISDIQVEEGKIQITRETKGADGAWAPAPGDALIQNQAGEEEKSVVSSRISDIKKTTYSLNLSSSDNKEKVLSITTPKEEASADTRELSLISTADLGKTDKRYYAYASGRLRGICYSVREAIGLVYDKMGVVVDSGGNYIWTRANRASEALIDVNSVAASAENERLAACLSIMLKQENITMDVAGELASGRTAYEILNEAFSGRALDLHGCILNQVLYYVDCGYPVLALTENDKAELIIGYDVYKNLIIYDSLTGGTYKISQDDAEAYYASYGYPFVSWIK